MPATYVETTTVTSITFASVRRELRTAGVTISARNEAGEYRVNLAGGTELTAYYTDDLVDALGTGHAMSCATVAFDAENGIESRGIDSNFEPVWTRDP